MEECLSWKLGLKAETLPVFEKVSQMDCVKGLFLCGGTAQSIQMQHRLSEDLDFELIGVKRERPQLNFSQIISEVTSMYPDSRKEILSQSHFQMYVEGNVKLSFFRPSNPVPILGEGFRHGNIVAPSLQELLGMKLFTITVRSEFRDFYDIYSLLQAGYDLKRGIDYACRFSRHNLHSKYIYSLLLNAAYFNKTAEFGLLQPRFDVTPADIVAYIKTLLV